MIDNNYISKCDKIIDFGCGRGKDTELLKTQGFNIVGYDEHNIDFQDYTILLSTYDVVICNYVFNVIPSLTDHRKLIDVLKGLSNEVYISVRKDTKAIKSNWIYKEEYLGYFTTRKTFQRFYDIDMIDNLFGKVEVIKETSSYILIRLLSI